MGVERTVAELVHRDHIRSGAISGVYEIASMKLTGTGEIGTNLLKFSDVLIKRLASDQLGIRNIGDTAAAHLVCADIYTYGDILPQVSGLSILPYNIDDSVLLLKARDNGVGPIEIASLNSGPDPFFGIGIAGSVIKGTNSGLIGFFTATPVGQQTGCAVPTDLASSITAITALRVAVNALGLTTVV